MKKRILFVLLMLHVGLAGMWAQEVSEKEAQERAQTFVRSHYGRKGGGPELKSLGQVNGLYVFNMNDKGGFVIVSNEERTTDILGYSESGQFDSDNMPDNMRAWLQGYADEIAWLQEHPDYGKESNVKTRAQVGTHSTNPIGPLVSTQWNQRTPYNNLCPNYSSGKKAVTGCVATAMAQVMNYHQWPQDNTAAIPEYKTKSYNIQLEGLAPIKFDWSNMLDKYESKDELGNTVVNGTEAEQKAVAELMQYCGHSVEMNYGPSSSSNSDMVAMALFKFFNYSSTTKVVSRGCYSYANWTDLIYNELKEGRPIVYSGQSYGGGHEFVCDGYKYENNTDLFHINWGWGGLSDGFFVLSSLNPDVQGAGGSSSNDGYHFGQDAVVGIQKAGVTDPVLNVPTNNYNLTINSINISHPTIALGESVDITINVTNSGTEAYDGDLLLAKNNLVFWGEMFYIPAGTIKQDYVIHYTPSKVGTEVLRSVFINNNGKFDGPSSTVTLNIVDQTPTDLRATDISSTTASIGWTNVGNAEKWNIRSKPFSITSWDFNDDSSWDIGNWNGDVYTWTKKPNAGINGSPCYASPSCTEGNSLNPYDWLISPQFDLGGKLSFYAWGENECFSVYVSTGGSWSSVSLYNTTTNIAKLYTFDISEYEGHEGRIAITHENSSGHTSESFLYVDDVSHFVPNGDWATISDVTTNPYILTGLTSNTCYEVQVQAVNNDGGNWSSSIMFNTEAFPSPENLTVSEVTPISAILNWTGSADSYDVRYGACSDYYGNEPTWLKYDDNEYQTNLGFGVEKEYTWGVMYPGSQVTCSKLTKVAFYESSLNSADITVKIYSGGDTPDASEATLLATTVVKPLSQGIHEVTFESPVEITLGANLWIILTETGSSPMVSCTKTDVPNNQWIYDNGNWTKIQNFGWMIRGYIEPKTVEWSTPVNCTGQSYKLTGLDPTKNYAVQVRGSYNSGGSSAWASTTFNKALSGSLELGDNNNNVGLIEGWNGYATTVTLKDRTLYKDDAWNTICLPFSLDAIQLAASPLAGADIRALSSGSLSGETLTLDFTPATGEGAVTSITAGTPYIIKWANGDDIVNPVFNGVTIDKTKHDVSFTGGKFVGTYESQSFTNANTSILFVGDGNSLFYPKAGASIDAQRAYFELSDGQLARAFNLNFGDSETTGILSTTNLTNYTNSNAWYDLSGRKLNEKPVKKGVYVQNGKKVVIK